MTCEPNPTGPGLPPLAPCCAQPNYVVQPLDLLRWEGFPLQVSIDSRSLSLVGAAEQVYRDAIEAGLQVWSVSTAASIGVVDVAFDRAGADLVVQLSEVPDDPHDDCNYFAQCDGEFVADALEGRVLRRGRIVLYPAHVSVPPAELPAYVAKLTGHEMGHALGLSLHSSDESDLMFQNARRSTGRPYPWLSPSDLNTLGTAYCR